MLLPHHRAEHENAGMAHALWRAVDDGSVELRRSVRSAQRLRMQSGARAGGVMSSPRERNTTDGERGTPDHAAATRGWPAPGGIARMAA
jgi:hypothetical protein